MFIRKSKIKALENEIKELKEELEKERVRCALLEADVLIARENAEKATKKLKTEKKTTKN